MRKKRQTQDLLAFCRLMIRLKIDIFLSLFICWSPIGDLGRNFRRQIYFSLTLATKTVAARNGEKVFSTINLDSPQQQKLEKLVILCSVVQGCPSLRHPLTEMALKTYYYVHTYDINACFSFILQLTQLKEFKAETLARVSFQ